MILYNVLPFTAFPLQSSSAFLPSDLPPPPGPLCCSLNMPGTLHPESLHTGYALCLDTPAPHVLMANFLSSFKALLKSPFLNDNNPDSLV